MILGAAAAAAAAARSIPFRSNSRACTWPSVPRH